MAWVSASISSRSILNLMNGDIRVESHPGEGSTFHLFTTSFISRSLLEGRLDENKELLRT